MKKRSRAHEAGSIEAGSSISKSFFFANRVDGVIVGSQIEPAASLGRPGVHKAAKSTQQGGQEQADRAIRGQMDPAMAPGAARSSQLRPDRASEGGPGSPCRSATRPADRATAKMDSSSSNFVMDVWLF